MKKLLALCLALLLLVSALPLAGAAFSDEASIDESYTKAVAAMAEKKIINGFADGSFGPARTLTRAQAAKILCVMLEGSEKVDALSKTETGFSDVPASHWAAKYVAYCAGKGIVAGIGNGRFGPDGKLSSGAFAKMLLVAYGENGSKFTGANWLKNVQAAAKPTLLLNHIKDGLSDSPVQRQVAAQLAYNALLQAEGFIPDYWQPYIEEKTNEINKLLENSGTSGDSFLFLTDYHRESNAGHSPALVDWLFRHTAVRFGVFGGDTQDMPANAEASAEAERTFLRDFRRSAGKMYNIIGNHDRLKLTDAQAYDLLLKDKESEYGSVSQHGDYYVDSPERKLRYFFLGMRGDNIPNGTVSWLCEELGKVPDDYRVVVFSHGSVFYSSTHSMLFIDTLGQAQMTKACTALNQNKTYEYDGVTYDYTNRQAKVLLIIGGHCHFDYDSMGKDMYPYGSAYKLLMVSVTSDAYIRQKNHGFMPKVVRTEGTITEQAFDVMRLDTDNSTLTCKRIGSGVDRIFHYGFDAVQGRVTLTPTLTGPLTWESSNPKRATVSEGTVQKTGEGIVSIRATDENGNLEVWCLETVAS